MSDLLTNRYSKARPLTQAIEDFIVESELEPGDLLPSEAVLGAQLGVSRTALREAMRTLNALDIVSIRHGHGTYVGNGSLSPMVSSLVFRGSLHGQSGVKGLQDILDVRIAVDRSNAAELCSTLAGTRNPVLHDLVNRMLDKAQVGDDFAEDDRAFHLELQNHLGNNLMTQLVGAFWDVHALLKPKLGPTSHADKIIAAEAHRDMVQAAETGDIVDYLSAIERHYGPLRQDLDAAKAAADDKERLASAI